MKVEMILAGGLTLAGGCCLHAEVLPFWGEGSPSTNRVAAAQKTLSISGTFETRTVDAISLSLDRFTSRAPGLHIHLR